MIRPLIYGFVILLSWLAGKSAHGVEFTKPGPKLAPCHPQVIDTQGTQGVVCTREGFDTLMKKFVDADAADKKAEIELAAERAHAADLGKAVTACLQSIPPPPPPPPSAFRKALPVALGIIGAGILVGSVAVDAPAGVQVAGTVVGLAAVTTGIVLAF